MNKSKSPKGITLIALIITIIVLLILAVVTIGGAVNDGGIIQHAQNAKTEYELAQEKEGVYLATNQAYLTGNGKITEGSLRDALNSQFGEEDIKWQYTETTENYLKFKIMKSKRDYKVYFNGTIEGTIGGETGGGATGGDSTGGEDEEVTTPWTDNGDGTYTNGKETIEIGVTTYTNAEVQKKLGATGGIYTGTWTVIGVKDNKIKLVSTENVASSVKLGKEDSEVFVKDVSGNPTTTLKSEIVEIYNKKGESNLDLEKAMWSYQHAVETLNNHAKKATGIASATSLTLEDLEAQEVLNITTDKKLAGSSSYGSTYNYFYNTAKLKVASKNKALGSDTWKDEYTTSHDSAIFIDREEKIKIVDSDKDEAIVDYTDFGTFYDFTGETKFASSLAKGEFWLASKCIVCRNVSASWAFFCGYEGYIMNGAMFSSTGAAYGIEHGVRAVVYM